MNLNFSYTSSNYMIKLLQIIVGFYIIANFAIFKGNLQE